MLPNLPFLNLRVSKGVKRTVLTLLAITVGMVVLWGGAFIGIKRDGERQRIVEDLDRRAACTYQYDTPECLKLRLKKAELKQQYEKDIQALKPD